MNNATFDDAPWRELSNPDQRFTYAFSLDVSYRVLIATGTAKTRMRLFAIEASERSTYHVQDDALTKGADGALHDVPRVRVVASDDWLEVGEDGVGVVKGVLVLQPEAPMAEPLKIEYRGIAHLPRGFERVQGEGRSSQIPGTACIATRHECNHPQYSWLTKEQLYGFGQVFVEQEPETAWTSCATACCRIKFSFDLYAAPNN
jgi:hypothetical protein